MLNSMGLGFLFTMKDMASAKMRALESRFASLDDRVTGGTPRITGAFKELGVGLAVFGAGAATVAGAWKMAGAAGTFEQGLAAIGAVTQATTRELALLRDAAIQAGIQTQFSPDEAVAGLTSLATAGQTAEQATRTLIPVLDLAAGSLGQLGVASAAEAVVGTLNAYGLAADQAASVTDRLLRSTQLTNFQTRDFSAGLAKAAAAGSTFGQDLDDVLITMGLLRNRNIDASSSATALREAIRRLGSDTRAQQAITGSGVAIYDKSSGKMRSIIDVMNDFAAATQNMTEEERNNRVAKAFGARGLLAFNAVQKAAFTTMENGVQVTLTGADAIAALRRQMGEASGTAEGFRTQLLDTFEGQKTLLKGTLQTFAVALGEPFAQVFKPMVKAVVDGLNFLLRSFNAIPSPIKKALAGVVVGAGALLMLVGGLIAAKGAISILAVGLKLMGISLVAMAKIFLPVIAVVGVLVAAVAGLHYAARHNLGGIADVATRLWQRVSLVFGALKQLFEQGGFSGAVRDELNRADNQGIKRFVIAIWQVVFRIRRVWQGFRDGLVAAMESMRPVIGDLVRSFSTIGTQVAGVFGAITGSAGGLPSDQFRSFGETVARVIGTVLNLGLRLVAVYARYYAGIASGFRSVTKYLGPAFAMVRDALVDLWNTLKEGLAPLGIFTDTAGESSSVWEVLGKTIGWIAGVIGTVLALALTTAIKLLTLPLRLNIMLRDGFVSLGTAVGETAARIYLWFRDTLPAAISEAVGIITGFFQTIWSFLVLTGRRFLGIFSSIVEGIKGFLQPVVDFFSGVGRSIRGVFLGIYDFVMRILRQVPDRLLPSSLQSLKYASLSLEVEGDDPVRTTARPQSALPSHAAIPAVADRVGRAEEMDALQQQILAFTDAQGRRSEVLPPIQLQVQVDGETIARAAHKADRDSAARAFAPVPVY